MKEETVNEYIVKDYPFTTLKPGTIIRILPSSNYNSYIDNDIVIVSQRLDDGNGKNDNGYLGNSNNENIILGMSVKTGRFYTSKMNKDIKYTILKNG